MNPIRTSTLAAVLGALLLAGCSQPATTAPTEGSAPAAAVERGAIATAIGNAMDEARRELREGNISVSSSDKQGAQAEITPEGDFLVDGRRIEISPEQRTLLLEHRARIVAVAEAGMQVGLEGADLATKAMKEALVGALSGQTEQIEARIEAEASRIKTSALELCKQLPALMASQQSLAASLPEFRPYATMTQADIDDCARDVQAGRVRPSDAAG